MSQLADFLVSQVRIIERGNEAAKKEAREQIPTDRVKDAPAMARELRWRIRLAGGKTSEDEGPQSSWKAKTNGNKRKQPTSPSPLDDSDETFKNFRPKLWDKVVETSAELETRSEKRRRPESEDWAEGWSKFDKEEVGDDTAEVRMQQHSLVKVRRTATGLERHRIERVIEKWKWD